jgi:tRNA-2-methylthio-N6-dimethylallyladenosine synthase
MTKKYHFWITGCQMNYADARQVATLLESHGYEESSRAEEADVIVLETCVVRQQAEDKAKNKLHSLAPLKKANPNVTLAVMGCLVGVKGNELLEQKFPFVDVFMPPQTDGSPLLSHLQQTDELALEQERTKRQHALLDGEVVLPLEQRGTLVSAPVSVVYGCSHACTFCIIPYRRGVERSRSVGEIVSEVRSLVRQGVREVVLLGQIVDRYGKDIPDGPDLADLLQVINDVDGLERIRFLTSHPNWMTDKLLRAVAGLPKVMPQIEVPVQAGDDRVLANMKRGYTAQQYRDLITRIRNIVPGVAIHCDIIVGFPGETAAQFQATYELLADLKLDKVHLARYSPRTGTVSARRMEDDVTEEDKWERFRLLEELQREISHEKTRAFLGHTVDVLVEETHKGRWRGRNPQNKLVFFDDSRDLLGQVVPVAITWAGPYSMSGEPADRLSKRVQAASNDMLLSVSAS